MTPFENLDSALDYVKSYEGDAAGLALAVSDEMNDPVGMNMAIICDCLLGKDIEPNGFEQKVGYRIYRYKKLGEEAETDA